MSAGCTVRRGLCPACARLAPLSAPCIRCSLFLVIQPAQPVSGGTYFAVDGDEAAVASASDMIAALGGRRLLVSGVQRALYHAAACMASNYLAALLQGSVRLLGQCGISQRMPCRPLNRL